MTLTTTEAAILACLERNRGCLVTPATLMLEVWGYEFDSKRDHGLLRAHLSNLRSKLPFGAITTVRSRGYVLDAPVPPRETCRCGALYEPRTMPGQIRWTACPAHRGADYDRARAELADWRAANKRRRRRAA